MKKLVAAILITVLGLGLCACGGPEIPDMAEVIESGEVFYDAGVGLPRDRLNSAWGVPVETSEDVDLWEMDGKYVSAYYENGEVVNMGVSSTMRAKIVEFQGELALIEPCEGQWELNSADRIFFSIDWIPEGKTAAVGDILVIEYDGMIMETYPAQIHRPYFVTAD